AFEQLGQITAKLHAHSKTWQAPENFQRIVWNHETMVGADGHWGNWKNAPHLRPHDHGVIEEAIAQISKDLNFFGKTQERY
ncbi:serine kinase, partial [Acinetobacter baumannii]